MAETDILNIHGIEVEYQVMKKTREGRQQRHFSFDCVADYETYFMAEDGIIPPLADNWRTSTIGDWVKADDGGVVQILRRGKGMRHPRDAGKYQYAKRGYVGTIVGTFICNDAKKMDSDFMKHPSRYSFATIDPKTYIPKAKDAKQLTRKKQDFVAQVVILSQSMKFMEMLIVAYQRAFSFTGNPMKAYDKGLALLRDNVIVRVLAKQISEAAEKNDVTVDYVMRGIKDVAEETNRDDVKLNAFVTLGKIIGMEDEVRDDPAQLAGGFQGFGNDSVIPDKAESLRGESEEADFSDVEKQFGVSMSSSEQPATEQSEGAGSSANIKAEREAVPEAEDDLSSYK